MVPVVVILDIIVPVGVIHRFQKCGHNDASHRGRVVFGNETYHIKSVMNTTGLSNVDVDLHGTLLWDKNIPYWLNHSLPVGYQNQSSAWLFGGENIRWDGFGYGTLDGNGQVWYDFINGTNNYPGRPHQITITGTTSSVFERTRFVQSQMWTMTIIHSSDILLEDIYINSTDTKQAVGFAFSSLNTDGADTIYADNIMFRGWTVDNGDDSISTKANSTNILMENCDFYTGLGVAVGSIGQYEGRYEIVENVTARNITINNMRYGAYFKTWTGVSSGYPPNGGGAGLGYAANITFEDFTLNNASGILAVTQSTSYNSASGNCDTSEFNLRDVTLKNWAGTTTSGVMADIQCSAASPCTGFTIEDMGGIVDTVNATIPAIYLCDNVVDPVGFNCTGKPWEENPRR
ncbi:Alpha-L-rhamnosidase rgxB [Fulvia fulva]|uniref:Alpha-L-rhamnosidase rgxB n=1 Tax=Passalora fulva TaxID=5499 RepID=A0A9Q8P5N4_PASFU|nr:Alpha-L-rhamnosidase rgxB [Fulvia fulva]KAK4631571.1 Alpha-L-rhamnosidase rgxB [Fulvia fulva]KAK4633582.1 Alpha-L-rhamnosidase rgxB [Fulvia fulva]UJO14114.1 Alpha-L-rhamnosidase rgxB [Fulvia fulva]WPV11896.1 Alpha-L-rhamnosidase rgxB [Fulvia fulva]WPV26135.1 Alpha-L-rhamnosidase rgxB [Fulvia fulva]